MRISSVAPTVLFAGGKDKLQTVNVMIDNQADPVDADLEFSAPSNVMVCHLSRIEHGKGTYQVSIPDLRKPVPVKFILKAGGQARDQLAMDWKPRKHWEIYNGPDLPLPAK